MMKFVVLFFTLFLLSCSKTCDNQQKPGCQDEPATDELCLAYFTRWFYNSNSNTCEEIGYSGCSAHGFASKTECEECQCD